jgi:ferrochelatase
MTGVILLQLGTPDAPTPSALRRYLRQFLSDRRVIDLPRLIWWPILYGSVLRTRPRESALLYQKVWTPEGSPLLAISNAQARGLERALTTRFGRRVPVVVGMRYGLPSIGFAVEQLVQAGVDRILAFPMYPQYAGATTGSSLEQLFRDVQPFRVVPSVRVVPPYFDDSGYIEALATIARDAIGRLPQPPTHVLFSFHGLPARYAELGDPYPQHCEATARLLAPALGLPSVDTQLVYQSQFGREVWLQPYTDKTLEALGPTGARVAVMCPGFTADCLETLEEIAIRGQEQFHSTGGRDYLAIPCLNDHPAWLEAMTDIAARELSGWMS